MRWSARASRTRFGDVMRSVLAYAVVPNALFWVLGSQLYMMRPVFNVDYLGLGCLAPWLPAPLLIAGIALGLVLDAVINVGPAFHLDLHELLYALGYVVHVNRGWVIAGAVGLIGTALVVGWGMVRTAGAASPRTARWLATLTALICAADIANGTSIIPLAVTRATLNFNVANSVVLKVGLALAADAKRSRARRMDAVLTEADSAAGPLLAAARDPSSVLPNRIGLVNVESWGSFRQQEIADELTRAFRSPEVAARYTVEQGQVPFHGVTIDGEFRELLAGVRLGWMGQTVPECLPKLLAARGYEAISLHGFTSQFYDRVQWYPKLGFTRSLFAQDLRAQGLTRTCGSGF